MLRPVVRAVVVAGVLALCGSAHGSIVVIPADVEMGSAEGSYIGPGPQCIVDLYLYDAVEIAGLDFAEGWLGDCSSPIEEVTITPDAVRPGVSHVTGFPAGFSGPTLVLTCNVFYYDDECPTRSLRALTFEFGAVAWNPDGQRVSPLSVCPVRFDCSYWPCTTQGPLVERACGDANGDKVITASDALAALQTGVGAGDCLPAQCDTNNDSLISAVDALRILRAGLSLEIELSCPFPCAAS